MPAAIRVLVDGRAADAVQAFTYVAMRDGTDLGLPSRAYLGHILRGAAYHGLPRSWQNRLGLLSVGGWAGPALARPASRLKRRLEPAVDTKT
jgi:hypothetical protein